MGALDVGLVLYTLVHTLSGIKRGLIHVLGSIAGLFVGAYVSLHHSTEIAEWFAGVAGFDIQQLGKWVTFIVIFIVISQLVGFIFWLVEQSVGFLVHLPYISSINHLLGGLLAFFEGVFFVGLVLYYAKYLPVPELQFALDRSVLAHWFIETSQVFVPLIPDSIKDAMKDLL